MEHTDKAAKNNHVPQTKEPVNVVLADDDKDDQEIFQDALTETNIPIVLATVDNGQELIDHRRPCDGIRAIRAQVRDQVDIPNAERAA